MPTSDKEPAYKESAASTSELLLGDAFEAHITTARLSRSLGPFSAVYREVNTPCGIADFIGVRSTDWDQDRRLLATHFDSVPKGPVGEIIGKLRKGMRRKKTLVSNSAYSPGVLESALSTLVQRNVVDRDLNTYRLSISIPRVELVVFEMKLSNWRRAAFQALQSTIYAQSAWCVFPLSKEKVLRANLTLFSNLNIGVKLYDEKRDTFTNLSRARKNSNFNYGSHLDVILRLASLPASGSSINISDQRKALPPPLST